MNCGTCGVGQAIPTPSESESETHICEVDEAWMCGPSFPIGPGYELVRTEPV